MTIPDLIETSIVIVGNSHNPSILSTGFLEKTRIVLPTQELDMNSIIITSALSQIKLKDTETILYIEPEKLVIKNKGDTDDIIRMASIYCQELPHIKTIAIGINQVYLIKDLKLHDLVISNNKLKAELVASTLRINITDKIICTIYLEAKKDNIHCKFNFESKYSEIPQSKLIEEVNLNSFGNLSLSESKRLIMELIT